MALPPLSLWPTLATQLHFSDVWMALVKTRQDALSDARTYKFYNCSESIHINKKVTFPWEKGGVQAHLYHLYSENSKLQYLVSSVQNMGSS